MQKKLFAIFQTIFNFPTNKQHFFWKTPSTGTPNTKKRVQSPLKPSSPNILVNALWLFKVNKFLKLKIPNLYMEQEKVKLIQDEYSIEIPKLQQVVQKY